ncbi:carbonic anhydrase 13-like [Discoglossus pictus]
MDISLSLQGHHQSPIDIHRKEAEYDSSLKPLQINYDPKTAIRIVNAGHCFIVEFEDTEEKSVLHGGPLTGGYRLKQFHFHWGQSDKEGSEHIIDGIKYPAELHIVHWNAQKYSTFEDAVEHPDGLAVLGVFLKMGETNPGIQIITENLDNIKTKEKEHRFTEFELLSLLPKDLQYWTYPGSLTTQPFKECVTWIILQKAITISSEQLNKFRGLLCTSENEAPCPILENARAVQPLEDRYVRSSCEIRQTRQNSLC